MKISIFKKVIIIGAIIVIISVNFNSIIISSISNDNFAYNKLEYSVAGYNVGTILYVGGNGPGNYTKIQDAINASSNGDTIFVFDDSSPYYENIMINKSITLIGENRNTTVMDGNGHGSVVYFLADLITISEFTISHSGKNAYDAGIFISSYSNSIHGNILTDNKYYGIYVDRSSNNLIFENSITNSDHCGIYLNNSCNNTTIFNNFISGHFSYGIYLSRSTNHTSIHNNTITNNRIGINVNGLSNDIYDNFFENEIGVYIYYSEDTIVVNNTFMQDGIIFSVAQTSLSKWNTHTIENNTLNGKPIRYYKNIDNSIIPNDTAQILLVNCTNFTIKNFNISYAYVSIQLGFCSYNQIFNNTLHDNGDAIELYCSLNNSITRNVIRNNKNSGISLTDSSHNTISGNIVTYSGFSIFLHGSSNNTNNTNNLVSDNTITHSSDGIYFLNADHNIVSGNSVENSTWSGIGLVLASNTTVCNNNISYTNGDGLIKAGIEIDSDNNLIFRNNIKRNSQGIYINGKNNSIQENTIENNTGTGISMYYFTCANNKIYHNNFINDYATNKGDNNTWDDGIGLGNYWSWYDGPDRDGNGIGDTPAELSGTGDVRDHYPLIFPYGEKPGVRIRAPENGFVYVRNLEILPFFTTLLLGNIKIKVSAANYICGINRVEFYIDNVLRKTDVSPPYDWVWRLSSHIKHRHTIKVIAYDNIGQNIIDDVVVLKFF